MSYIITHTGTHFHFPPAPRDHRRYLVRDIAHALAHLCRFNGHTEHFYSVAQHSLLVARLLPPELALAGLLHDAQEAYMGDMATPLKQLMPAYRDMECQIEAELAAEFGLHHPMHPLVKEADLTMLATEAYHFFGHAEAGLWESIRYVKINPYPIKPVRPSDAEEAFLSIFQMLTQNQTTKES
jgi:5'-deoxynucleotidase YfbR-like HD superfamily hydrolase